MAGGKLTLGGQALQLGAERVGDVTGGAPDQARLRGGDIAQGHARVEGLAREAALKEALGQLTRGDLRVEVGPEVTLRG